MLAKDVKKGELIRKVFDVGEVKDHSFVDENGDEIKRLSFTITSNRRDRDKDIVNPEGCMVDDYANNPIMLWAHDYESIPIARSVEMSRVKEHIGDGENYIHKIHALVTFQPDDNYQPNWTGITGGMIYNMYKTGFLNAVSIGFNPLSWEPIEEKDEDANPFVHTGVKFNEWDMLEFSAVPVPANPDALVDRDLRKSYVKNLKSWADQTIEKCEACKIASADATMTRIETAEAMMADAATNYTLKDYGRPTKGVIPYKQTPKGEGAWDGPAQIASASVDVLKLICTWFDSANPDLKTAYKLPHHLASGDHTLIKQGLIGCGNAIQGARGGVNIPAGDIPGVKSHLEKHYHEFDMKAPWEPKAEAEGTMKKLDKIKSEVKAGRVLSAANEATLKEAATNAENIAELIESVLQQVTGEDWEAPENEPKQFGNVSYPLGHEAPILEGKESGPTDGDTNQGSEVSESGDDDVFMIESEEDLRRLIDEEVQSMRDDGLLDDSGSLLTEGESESTPTEGKT